MPDGESDLLRRLSTATRVEETHAHDAIDPSSVEVPTLTVLAHPDGDRIGELVTLPELAAGGTVELSRLAPDFAPPSTGPASALGDAAEPAEPRPLADPYLSRRPLLLRGGAAAGAVDVLQADSPTRVRLDGRPPAPEHRLGADDLARGVVVELGRHVVLLLHLQPALMPRLPRFGLVGDSGAMMRLRREIQQAARLDTPVLLRGASGSGKELVAQALHESSRRHSGPWVAVNMAAIPSSLAAAELFGTTKGAFTGANRAQPGFFVAADGGTLFLDEIGDTPPEIQPLLLRALESGEIQPVGGATTRRVDVRVLAATDADLDDAVATGRFRAPLLHRLAAWEIRLPSLAERRSDVGRLVVHFLRREQSELALEEALDTPPPNVMARLARAAWPGNVRQLRNVVRRLAIGAQTLRGAALLAALEPLLDPLPEPRLDADLEPSLDDPAPQRRVPEDRPLGTSSRPHADPSPTGRWRPVYRPASEVSDDELVATLRARRWDLKRSAEALGVSRATLYTLIERCPRVRTAARLGRAEIEAALASTDGDEGAAAEALEVSARALKMRIHALGLR
ncbi:MAG: sigma 54-interacting transcriptional regulator [Acidobacteriota bacterium]